MHAALSRMYILLCWHGARSCLSRLSRTIQVTMQTVNRKTKLRLRQWLRCINPTELTEMVSIRTTWDTSKVLQFDISDATEACTQTDQLLCFPYSQADCSTQTSDSSSSSFEDASTQSPDDETYVVFLPKFHSDDVNANAINAAVKNGIWEPFADGDVFEAGDVVEVVGNVRTIDDDEVISIRLPFGLVGRVGRRDHSDGDDAHMFFPGLKDNAHPVYPWRWIAGEDVACFKKCVDGSGLFQVDGDQNQNQD
ncbi:unnamed protein product, partial [Polarella glacialis]